MAEEPDSQAIGRLAENAQEFIRVDSIDREPLRELRGVRKVTLRAPAPVKAVGVGSIIISGDDVSAARDAFPQRDRPVPSGIFERERTEAFVGNHEAVVWLRASPRNQTVVRHVKQQTFPVSYVPQHTFEVSTVLQP